MDDTDRPAASVPDIVQPNGAVPAFASRTRSENCTSTVLREVTFADETAGAVASFDMSMVAASVARDGPALKAADWSTSSG